MSKRPNRVLKKISATRKSTSLRQPRENRKILARPELCDRIREGLSRRLILVQAQAGQGKTFLVAEALKNLKPPAVWITSPEAYASLADFIRAVISGLSQALSPKPSAQFLAALTASTRSQPAESELSGALANYLWQHASRPLYLILDNYHLAKSDMRIDLFLESFLNELPPLIHVIMVTRHFPELSVIHRLRAAGEILEFDNRALKLSSGEIRKLYREVFSLDLSDEEAGIIAQASEGWLAGAMMTAAALRSLDPQEREEALNLKSFYALAPPLRDVFQKEVLEGLSPAEKKLLLNIGPAETISEDLGKLLAETEQAPELLYRLARKNSFIYPADGPRPLYRCHGLFRQFLQDTLKEEAGAEAVSLQINKIGDYYLAQNQTAQALDIYAQGDDFHRLAALLEERGRDFLQGKNIAQLQTWLNHIPEDVYVEYPHLFYLRARTHYPLSALSDLSKARKEFSLRGDRKWELIVSALLIPELYFVTSRREEIRSLIDLIEKVWDTERHRLDDELNAHLALILGFVHAIIYGEIGSARTFLDEASYYCRRRQDDDLQLLLIIIKVYCAAYSCNNYLLEQTLEQGEQIIQRQSSFPMTTVRFHLCKTISLIIRGRYQEASSHLESLKIMTVREKLWSMHFIIFCLDAFIAGFSGNARKSARLLAQFIKLGKQLDAPVLIGISYCYLLMISVKEHFPPQTDKILARTLPHVDFIQSEVYRQHLVVIQGVQALRRGNLPQAISLLEQAIHTLRAHQCYQLLAQALFYRAEAAYQEDRPEEADSLLREALFILEQGDSVHLSCFAREYVLHLCRKAQAANMNPDYLKKFIAANFPPETLPPAFQEPFRIYTLGGFKVIRAVKDQEITLPLKGKLARLLALLLHSAEAGIPRDKLTVYLWEDDPPERVKQNLDAAIFRMRRLLEPELPRGGDSQFLSCRGKILFLNYESVWVDTFQFRRLAGQGEKLAGQGEITKAIAALEQARKLYRGEYLRGFKELPEPVLKDREEFRETFLKVGALLGRIYLETDRAEEALNVAEEALAINPLHEECRLVQLGVLTRSGEKGRLKKVLQDYEILLTYEYGPYLGKNLITQLYERVRESCLNLTGAP